MAGPTKTAPERVTVPTCIGCGAMGEYGTCETGCIERRLELVRAAASDTLSEVASQAHASANAFQKVAEELIREAPVDSGRYRALQDRARAALACHPDTGRDEEWTEPSEPAVTWWCAECGAIDAPQPCLGICVWRPVEWVNRAVYEQARERAFAARAHEQRLRRLLRAIASVTPRPEHLEQNWQAFQRQARTALVGPAAE